jgi:maleamate amidohydrolase
MASIDKFNEHCWKDVIPEADLELYAGWRRETFVGARPALLAIDLYDLVYRGGPHSPNELNARYPNSCGVFAHRAIAPTKRLLAAARRAGIPIFYCTQETRPQNRPKGAVSTRQRIAVPPPRRLRHQSRNHAAAGRRQHHKTACQHLPAYTAVLASLAARHS